MKIHHILMPTDFSDCSNQALDPALFLAEQFDADLHFLHVVTLHHEDPRGPEEDFPSNDVLFRHLRDISTAEMENRANKHPLRIHEHVRRGIAAAPEIVALAGEKKVELIVMGGHGRRGLRRMLLGSVAEEVVRTAPCPVLTLRGNERLRRPKKILVPVDFSKPSKEGLRTALTVAQLYEASLEIVHVVEQPVYPQVYEGFYSWLPAGSFSEMRAELAANLEEFVAEVCGERQVAYTLSVLEGDPAQEICARITASKVDLTVIATHGLTGLEHLLLGSVAERVVRGAESPVLTVKAPPAAETKTDILDVEALAA